MAKPSEAELQTQWKNATKILEELRKFASVTATNNYVSLEDAYVASPIKTDYPELVQSGLAIIRSRLDAAIRDSPRILAPIFLQYADLISQAPEKAIGAVLRRVYDDFVANSKTIKSRAFTFGSPAASGSPVGNGAILRLNKDENNFDIEAQFPDAKRARCIHDQAAGAEKHEEVFEFRSDPAYKDALKYTGSGDAATVACPSARNSLLNNPSFDSRSGTDALPTAITDWTSDVAVVGDGTDYTFDATNYYRDYPGQATPKALKIKLTRTLSQKFSVRRTKFDPNRPYMLQIAWNRAVGGASGTLALHLGSKSNSVAVSAQTGWQVLRLLVDQNLWYKNWRQDDGKIQVVWTRTAGDLLVDDVLLVPFQPFAGSWYLPIGGSTAFAREDTFTWSDTATDAAILQRWIWLAFGTYLPHSATPSITDPA